MKINTFVVDDESLARQRMKELLADHSDIEVIGEFSTGQEAKVALMNLKPELILLDVQMPRMTGLKLAKLLDNSDMPLVVFITAHDGFAVEAFDTRAVDYLLKPVRPERLARALERVRDQLSAIRETASGEVPPNHSGPRRSLSRLMVKNGDRVTFIKAEEIRWIESAGNYVVVSAGQERHIIRETMSALESELSPKDFVRLNRSLIVNLGVIAELKSQGQGDYFALLKDGKRASVTVGLHELERRLRFG
jgi:two-component system LytT family response regulator